MKTSALALILLVFIISLGATILGSTSGLMSTQTSGTIEYNITNEGLYALEDYSDWFGTIVTAVIFVAIIAIIYMVAGSARR